MLQEDLWFRIHLHNIGENKSCLYQERGGIREKYDYTKTISVVHRYTISEVYSVKTVRTEPVLSLHWSSRKGKYLIISLVWTLRRSAVYIVCFHYLVHHYLVKATHQIPPVMHTGCLIYTAIYRARHAPSTPAGQSLIHWTSSISPANTHPKPS